MTRSAEIAKRRRRVLRLYESGLTQREIAQRLEMPGATVALDLKMSPGYAPRPTLASFELAAGKITAAEAAERHGLKLLTLCQAIDAGIVRGERVKLGRRTIRTLDPLELEDDLARLPRCGFEDCEAPALAPGGGCCGPHGAALFNRGRPKSTETRGKIAAGLRGKPRPDVRERVAQMHADPVRHAGWRFKLAQGRNLSPDDKRAWGGRLGGMLADQKHGGRPHGHAAEDVERVVDLRGKGLSIRTIARLTGLSKSTVSRIIQVQKVSQNPS